MLIRACYLLLIVVVFCCFGVDVGVGGVGVGVGGVAVGVGAVGVAVPVLLLLLSLWLL